MALPDGVELDAKMLDTFTPILKELGLSNDAAQKLAAAKVSYDAALAEEASRQAVEQRKAWVTELKQDPKFDSLVKNANRAVSLVPPGPARDAFVAYLNETGQGDNPVIVRAMAAIGERFGEQPFVPNQGGGGNYKEKRAADVIFPEFANT